MIWVACMPERLELLARSCLKIQPSQESWSLWMPCSFAPSMFAGSQGGPRWGWILKASVTSSSLCFFSFDCCSDYFREDSYSHLLVTYKVGNVFDFSSSSVSRSRIVNPILSWLRVLHGIQVRLSPTWCLDWAPELHFRKMLRAMIDKLQAQQVHLS